VCGRVGGLREEKEEEEEEEEEKEEEERERTPRSYVCMSSHY